MSMIGKTLGTFECTALLGKGGMGEVYRAKDQKLGRDVAIKVLPEEFAKDADRVARFQREAKLLASLNHPNIAAIHGLEESEGTHFLVLELIEGDTLADRLKRGAIPVEESLKLALQIAEALEAAHEKGVIHRDLKPANIKVTPDGKVKVLDFGLAKAFAGDSEDINLSNSPTLSVAATQQGIILGTAAYMSPEQASGETTDKRTDIWAFGVVLFEMLTGRSLFEGNNVSRTLASVIKSEPEWENLPPNLHSRIRFLIERCLEKEAKNRYSSISDARVEIQKVLADPSGVFAQHIKETKPQKRVRLGIPWIAAIAILCLVISGMAVWILKPIEPKRVMRFDHHLSEGQQFNIDAFGETPFAVAPDGSHFIYGTPEGLYIRSVAELDSRLIPGTDRGSFDVCFSPDGKWIAYFSATEMKLNKIPISGGAPVALCDVQSFDGVSWNIDNTIVFGGVAQGIMRVSADGGTPKNFVEGTSDDFFAPHFLPDGKSLIFTAWNRGISKIIVQSTESGEQQELIDGGYARYLPTGHLVYLFENNLFAVPFDPDTLEVTGGSISMIEGVWVYTISGDGTLFYIPGVTSGGTVERMLVWVDREGNEEPISAQPRDYGGPKISPDGSKFALTIDEGGNEDIWIWDIARKNMTRLTINEASDEAPLWSPDGQRIVFTSDRDGTEGIYWQAADGAGEVEAISIGSAPRFIPAFWSNDRNALLVTTRAGNYDIGMLSMEKNHESEMLLQKSYNERQPQISPDGEWIAYASNESGKYEIYVRPFPEVNTGRSQVSTSGGFSPLWSPDGKELYYRNGDSVMAVSIMEKESGISFGVPEVLFSGAYASPLDADLSRQAMWDIHPDGKQFLMIKPPQLTGGDSTAETQPKINIVLNWFEELKDRVPVD